MFKKRGQITIFIIIAILIIGIVALFFIFKSNINIGKKQTYAPEVAPIVNFVQECLDETLKEGVLYLASHGGYLDPIESTKNEEAYYFKEGTNYFPTKEKFRLFPLPIPIQAFAYFPCFLHLIK